MRLTDAKANQVISRWRRLLGVNPLYKFFVRVNNSPDPNLKPRDRKEVEATCEVDQAYWKVKLTINAYEFDAEDLEYVIVHELLHVILARTETLIAELHGKEHTETARNLIESNAEQLAQAVMYVKKGKRP